MGDTSGAGTANPSEASEFTPGFLLKLLLLNLTKGPTELYLFVFVALSANFFSGI
jgi:hypothetical protein